MTKRWATIFICIGGLVLLFFSATIQARWVYFELCSLVEGPGKSMIGALSGQPIRGDAWLQADEIRAIIPHAKYEGCTLIYLRDGGTLSFKGTPLQIACKISHAPTCKKVLHEK